jgi:triosephosphate isomerase
LGSIEIKMARRPLVAANWKMNGLKASIAELERIIAGARSLPTVDLVVCPPATLVAGFAAKAKGTSVAIGGQDCHAEAVGAYTGDISAEMLRDAGATAVIVGHSERRRYHGESDAQVRAKAMAARRAGLLAIICIGETRAERDAGHTRDILQAQLDGSLPDDGANIAIAYEPVWAIGTGVTPTRDDVAETHAFVRARLTARLGGAAGATRILYGGSVKPSNARDLLSVDDVDGALVGGASLSADAFLAIAGVYRSP